MDHAQGAHGPAARPCADRPADAVGPGAGNAGGNGNFGELAPALSVNQTLNDSGDNGGWKIGFAIFPLLERSRWMNELIPLSHGLDGEAPFLLASRPSMWRR